MQVSTTENPITDQEKLLGATECQEIQHEHVLIILFLCMTLGNKWHEYVNVCSMSSGIFDAIAVHVGTLEMYIMTLYDIMTGRRHTIASAT